MEKVKSKSITSGAHEDVVFFRDKKTGLRGVIAIHNTNRGPAAGATRYATYKTEKEAIADALRLSRGMTYKAAMADLPFGGGKAVIMREPSHRKTKSFLRAYGQVIDSLNGRFYTGQDVGMTARDVLVMAEKTNFVIGKTPESSNPPYWTAVGIREAMRAALKYAFGSSSIRGRKIAIKGVGNVGSDLARLLYKDGAKLFIADIDSKKTRKLAKELPGTKIVSHKDVHAAEVDVFSPCALAHDLNKKTVNNLKCRVVCGGANNQLSDPSVGELLHKRRIIYIPDYVANAGGMINVLAEIEKGGYDVRKVERRVKNIRKTTEEILARSEKSRKPTNFVADKIAEQRISLRKKRNA